MSNKTKQILFYKGTEGPETQKENFQYTTTNASNAISLTLDQNSGLDYAINILQSLEVHSLSLNDEVLTITENPTIISNRLKQLQTQITQTKKDVIGIFFGNKGIYKTIEDIEYLKNNNKKIFDLIFLLFLYRDYNYENVLKAIFGKNGFYKTPENIEGMSQEKIILLINIIGIEELFGKNGIFKTAEEINNFDYNRLKSLSILINQELGILFFGKEGIYKTAEEISNINDNKYQEIEAFILRRQNIVDDVTKITGKDGWDNIKLYRETLLGDSSLANFRENTQKNWWGNDIDKYIKPILEEKAQNIKDSGHNYDIELFKKIFGKEGIYKTPEDMKNLNQFLIIQDICSNGDLGLLSGKKEENNNKIYYYMLDYFQRIFYKYSVSKLIKHPLEIIELIEIVVNDTKDAIEMFFGKKGIYQDINQILSIPESKYEILFYIMDHMTLETLKKVFGKEGIYKTPEDIEQLTELDLNFIKKIAKYSYNSELSVEDIFFGENGIWKEKNDLGKVTQLSLNLFQTLDYEDTKKMFGSNKVFKKVTDFNKVSELEVNKINKIIKYNTTIIDFFFGENGIFETIDDISNLEINKIDLVYSILQKYDGKLSNLFGKKGIIKTIEDLNQLDEKEINSILEVFGEYSILVFSENGICNNIEDIKQLYSNIDKIESIIGHINHYIENKEKIITNNGKGKYNNSEIDKGYIFRDKIEFSKILWEDFGKNMGKMGFLSEEKYNYDDISKFIKENFESSKYV